MQVSGCTTLPGSTRWGLSGCCRKRKMPKPLAGNSCVAIYTPISGFGELRQCAARRFEQWFECCRPPEYTAKNKSVKLTGKKSQQLYLQGTDRQNDGWSSIQNDGVYDHFDVILVILTCKLPVKITGRGLFVVHLSVILTGPCQYKMLMSRPI